MSQKYPLVVCSKETIGGGGVFLNQISYLNKKYSVIYLLYKKNLITNLNRHAKYLNSYYPEYYRFSILKFLIFIKNFVLTCLFIRKNLLAIYFTTNFYTSIIILLAKRVFFKNIKAASLINININSLIKSKPNKIYQFILFRITKLLYKNNNFVFVSTGLAQYCSNLFELDKEKITIINSSIRLDLSIRKYLTQRNLFKRQNDTKEIRIISVGRLDWPKDFRTLLTSFYHVSNRFNNIKLYIVGEGRYRMELEKLANRLGIASRTYFMGWKKNIYPYLAKSHIFVLSTLSDAFPRSLLEAMEIGLPVICTDVEFGPREILDNGKYGLLVRKQDINDLKESLTKLIQNKKLRVKYAQLALQRIKKYDFDYMIRNYEKFFTKIKNAN